MKKIACVGYHGTGAGIIDDLFREFDNVCHGTYEAEVRILHDPDGISDLEYHLVTNPHRLGTGVAIKRFINYCQKQQRQASRVFGDQWINITKDYAESLALFEYKGYTNGDLPFISTKDWCLMNMRKVINRLKPRKYRKAPWYNYLPNLTTYYSLIDEDEFLRKTKSFVERLCELANKDCKEYVMLDQFISSSNPEQCLRYVDDIKAIIVDRDPRDLYINQILCGSHVLPKDPHQFCIMYKKIRKVFGQKCQDSVMWIRFEDMIYNYDVFVEKVINFVGIDCKHHVFPKKYFNPNDSGARTQLWLKYTQFSEAISIIEKTIPDYLYPFPEGKFFDVIDEKANMHHLNGRI